MTRDLFIKKRVPETVSMNPMGIIADTLTPDEFNRMHTCFFDSMLEIGKADISGIDGYGEFNDDNRPIYKTCREYLTETFAEDYEGYWYHWHEMYETTMLSQDFFEKYYEKMTALIPFCEGRRYLVNNNTFFINMITDGSEFVGFSDWSRSGVTDFLLDLVCMDLNKPYLQIPELFYAYCAERGIDVPDFKERFLCMAYYKGIDTLRWHASIDDTESCQSIMKSIDGLESRIQNL